MKITKILKYILLFGLIFILTDCREKVSKENEKVALDQSKLSLEILRGESWWENPLSKLGNSIIFDKEYMYQIDFSGEGCGQHWKGDFEIKKDGIVLKKGIQQVEGCQPDREETFCSYEKAVNPVYSLYFLKCKDGSVFWNPAAIIPTNTEKILDGIQVESLAGKKGVTTDDAKLREKPNVNSKSYGCRSEFSGDMESKPFVPNKTNLVLLFKTKEKQKVKNWENYWYYVFVDLGWYGGCDAQDNLGWIYGEFVEEK